MRALSELHADIDRRVELIRSEHPNWLCRSGCEGCCHRLAEIPQLTTAEWDLLRQGIAALPQELHLSIGQDIAAIAEQQSRPFVCPLLDKSTGTCRVYLNRPISCRTYGFYVQRDKGLFCKDIEAQVASGQLSDVVWGNEDSIDLRLKGLGETREFTAWFADWKASYS